MGHCDLATTLMYPDYAPDPAQRAPSAKAGFHERSRIRRPPPKLASLGLGRGTVASSHPGSAQVRSRVGGCGESIRAPPTRPGAAAESWLTKRAFAEAEHIATYDSLKPVALNQVKAVERGVDQLCNYIASTGKCPRRPGVGHCAPWPPGGSLPMRVSRCSSPRAGGVRGAGSRLSAAGTAIT